MVMINEEQLQLFEDQTIRSAWDEEHEEWRDRGITAGKEYAQLTDEITKAWSGMSTTELVLNMLAETATKDISWVAKSTGFDANKDVAQRGGSVAAIARQALEEQTGNV